MSEYWEKVIEHELEFYANIRTYEEELLDRLRENEMSFQYPVTIFDEVEGRVYRACAGTEEQALSRIEKRESIETLLKKAAKRINRLNNAITQLDELEQDIISIFYLEKDLSELHMVRLLGFRTRKEFLLKKEQALKKLFSIYEKERSATHKEFKQTLIEERKKKVAVYKQTLLPKSQIKSII